MFKKLLLHPITIFFSTALVFFWPLSLFFFTLKNDALTYYYPVRTLISDALHNGELPLWTPFINMGYPLHADMQSGAWNPVTWAFSFLTNYPPGAFHYELIFYITFAGVGFYYLCKNFGCSKTACFIMGVAYQFSGFMIDSVQFFNCISAACYIPWIVFFFRRMMLQRDIKNTVGLAVFMYLLFTGGYPSFFIVMVYVLLFYSVYFLLLEKNKILFLKRFAKNAGIASLLFLLLSLPALVSFIQHLPMIERGKAQPLSFVLQNSLNPATSLSFIAPFATTAGDGWLHSEILMRSMYVGIVPLLFLMLGFFSKAVSRDKECRFFFIIAMVMLGLAWGKYFFFRQAAYYALPLMNSFRHPALFRFFTIFFFLLIAARSFTVWEGGKRSDTLLLSNIVKWLFILFIIACAVMTGYLIHQHEIGFLHLNDVTNIFTQLNFEQRFLVQSVFLFTTLLFFYNVFNKKNSTRLLFFVSLFDLFFATQLNIPVTVIGSKSFGEMTKLINRNKERFPVPDNQSIEENSFNSSGDNIVTGSTMPFIKKIGRNDYYITPGNLSMQDRFYESNLKDPVFKNPSLYYVSSMPYRELNAADENNFIASRKSPGDIVMITALSANSMDASIDVSKPGTLIYLQNNYPGWKVFIDGKEQSIKTVNICFMSVEVAKGKHSIRFCYKPINIIIAWFISSATLAAIAAWLLIGFLQKRDQGNTKRKA